MLEIFLAVATITSLTVLYKFLPNRRIFVYFCMSLVVVFAIAGFIARSQQPQETINAEERRILQQQQEIFTNWYSEYQKDIDQIDRNWQLYHSIIEDFTSDSIDVDAMYERLLDLETEARIEQVHIYTLKAPPDVGTECTRLIEIMLKKTQSYVDAQTQTIAMSKAVIETESFSNASHQEQVHLFQDIIIREAPIGLFTADELSAILQYFTLPEDFPTDNQTGVVVP